MNAERRKSAGWATGVSRHSSPDAGRLLSCSLPASGLSAFSFLSHAFGRPRFFWRSSFDDTIYAGFGIAAQLFAWGTDRFREIEHQAELLFEGAELLGKHEAPILPRLFGGFSFRDDFVQDNVWAAFQPSHFILPHYQFIQRGEESWLTINAMASADDAATLLRQELQAAVSARLDLLKEPQRNLPALGSPDEKRYPMTEQDWRTLIKQAVNATHRSTIQKVVLARICELRYGHEVDSGAVLAYLTAEYPDCTQFLFEPRPFHAFFGATPERLIRLDSDHFVSMALAGSRPRGMDSTEDALLGDELLQSAKERYEHQLVVEALRRRLEPISAQLAIPSLPEVLPLSYIQHLYTPISGTLVSPRSVLSLVELLHPTPALGGSPRDRAMAFIKRYEPVPRGWYAAPVGWFDSTMNGEFAVAIRSAVAQERRVWCYAGAGIVAESQPDVEWAETELKFRPMLRALGAAPPVAD